MRGILTCEVVDMGAIHGQTRYGSPVGLFVLRIHHALSL